MRTSIFPMRSVHLKPAFWGLDRDLKDVIDNIDSIWEGGAQSYSEFKETDKAYFMSLDIPGVKKKNLDIQIEEDHILVTTTRSKMLSADENDLSDSVTRRFILPKSVNRDEIQAHVEEGVLYLAMPKIEKAQPRKVDITEGFSNTTWNNLLDQSESK